MDSDLDIFSDEEIFFELNLKLCRRPRVIRNRPNHFNEWDDVDFYARFRLSKESAYAVLELIAPHIQHPTSWNAALSPEHMLLLTLLVYATGCMLITAGDFCGVSKATACRVVAVVSHHIALLKDHFIVFPNTEEEIQSVRAGFFHSARFPRVIAALDCTHVRILSPGGQNGELFRCRKGFFSINVQTMCDSQLKFLDIVARWPGSAHDSTIFNNSRICARFESREFADSFIIADGGYQCRNYMMTPLAEVTTTEENLYNESLIRTRNCVERSYGIWKRRFPILSIGMRMKLPKIQSIIVAAAVLHNICCMNSENILPALSGELEAAVNFVSTVPRNELNPRSTNENLVRRSLINTYFKNLV